MLGIRPLDKGEGFDFVRFNHLFSVPIVEPSIPYRFTKSLCGTRNLNEKGIMVQ